MATIGDFIISDGMITSCDREYTKSIIYRFIGEAVGCSKLGSKEVVAFNSNRFQYNTSWAAGLHGKIITIDDLLIFAEAIEKNHYICKSHNVKNFIKRATEFVLLRN